LSTSRTDNQGNNCQNPFALRVLHSFSEGGSVFCLQKMYRRVKNLNKNVGKLQIKTLRYIHLSKAAVNTQGERNENNSFSKTQQKTNLFHTHPVQSKRPYKDHR
jgi:hypothetical protein